MALAGIIENLGVSLTYGFSSSSALSSSVTNDWECATLVVVLSIIGVSYFSESSYASFIYSLHSALSPGSSIGVFDAIA